MMPAAAMSATHYSRLFTHFSFRSLSRPAICTRLRGSRKRRKSLQPLRSEARRTFWHLNRPRLSIGEPDHGYRSLVPVPSALAHVGCYIRLIFRELTICGHVGKRFTQSDVWECSGNFWSVARRGGSAETDTQVQKNQADASGSVAQGEQGQSLRHDADI